MDKMEARKQITGAGVARARLMEFGQPITNVCAGESNPRRHAYFVTLDIRRRENRFGAVQTERLVRCTDGKGEFWDTYTDVIYPGHLSVDEAEHLFAPIHAALYG